MEETHTTSASDAGGRLQEILITLPRWLVALLLVLVVVGAVAAGWLAATSPAESVREVAKSVLLVLLPMVVLVLAAIGVRRTSTTQVDELVTAFVEKTLLQRFQLACGQRTFHDFPFTAVRLVQPTGGRSYAGFDFDWADGARQGEPARVWVKMNVLNFEVIVDQAIRFAPAVSGERLPSAFFDAHSLGMLLDHPVAQHMAMTLQGSIEEGYKIRLILEPTGEPGTVLMHLSFRQKLREHFLASPFLKRYYAEDAAILVGILFRELQKSPLLAPATPGRKVTV
jgi:hypothetical protein